MIIGEESDNSFLNLKNNLIQNTFWILIGMRQCELLLVL